MTQPADKNITLRIRTSSGENPQSARMIIDAQGHRAISLMDKEQPETHATVYPAPNNGAICHADRAGFDRLWEQLIGLNLNWQRVAEDLKETTIQASIPPLISLCRHTKSR